MTIDRIIEFAKHYSGVSIYGAGLLGRALAETMVELGVSVQAFLVSDDQDISQPCYFSIPVMTLSSWANEMTDNRTRTGILVSVSKSYQSAIVKNLKEKQIFDYLLVDSEVLHESMRRLHPVDPVSFLATINPVSRGFGSERGKPIDRVYIERFLHDASQGLQDARVILEVGSDTYSRQYFSDITESMQYHILRHDQGMDLTNVRTLPQNRYDVFVCTQVFNFIYDVKAAVRGAYYLLKPGGTLLATVQGCVGQVSRTDMRLWGDYWRFTDLGIGKLIGEIFGEDQVKAFPYGNALAATAFVQGMALEDIPDEDLLNPVESEYAICVGVIAQKKG